MSTQQSQLTGEQNNTEYHGLEIAIIGMSGRFPGANHITEFWQNLIDGKESIRPLSDSELKASGVDDATLADPDWLKVGAPIADSDLFDASFFGFSPREAEILDPQQRVFLECAWHALEDAGYDAGRYNGNIGVFGGTGMNGYLLNLYSNPQVRKEVSPYELFLANDKDFLTTRVSYKLGLQGPSLDVQTACSTSLVAVHLACQSLISGESDMALSGGVAISKQMGYKVQQGGIYSPDGHCRAFDADAAGTVGGNGVGIVVLKRLSDAQQDGDNILAVIKGSAINNDGNNKVSFTAPSLESQAAVIQTALGVAEVSPSTVGYIEAHGTGTTLGDPIEMAALTRAFNQTQEHENKNNAQCVIGSVKTNIGHLDAAAGIASLIKTTLIVREGQIPASLHFKNANPQIDFSNSPFKVNAVLNQWQPSNNQVRRAGVSCFGIGGTNAHIILEQYPQPLNDSSNQQQALGQDSYKEEQLLVLSAQTEAALQKSVQQLSNHLKKNKDISLADMAFTLQNGRKAFKHRLSITAKNILDVIKQLDVMDKANAIKIKQSPTALEQANLVWMFAGQGSQYPAMAQHLYTQQATFKQAIDACATVLDPLMDVSLADLLCDPKHGDTLNQTLYAQPALFSFEYALTQYWLSLGLQPKAMIGHSLGEYVAACISGVFTLETALNLVFQRARCMQKMPKGSMLAIMASSEVVFSWIKEATLEDSISIAAMNAQELTVVSGSIGPIGRIQLRCQAAAVGCQALRTSHAFHSPLMNEAANELKEIIESIIQKQGELSAPTIPFISNVSGKWIKPEQATSADYWKTQMQQTVHFAKGLDTLLTLSNPVFLEIGAGSTLSDLVKLSGQSNDTVAHTCISVNKKNNGHSLLASAGVLWEMGAALNWRVFHPQTPHLQKRKRVSLPGYPFQKQRYWISGKMDNALSPKTSDASPNKIDKTDAGLESNKEQLKGLSDWAYTPSWQSSPLAAILPDQPSRQTWLLLLDENGLGKALGKYIEAAGYDLYCVKGCDKSRAEHDASLLTQSDYREFTFNTNSSDNFRLLQKELEQREQPADFIVDCRLLSQSSSSVCSTTFNALHALALAWSEASHPTQMCILTQGACQVVEGEINNPSQAMAQGFSLVVGQEYPQLGCRQIDLAMDCSPLIAKNLWSDLRLKNPPALVALRGHQRWQQTFQALQLPKLPKCLPRKQRGLHQAGSYLIIGDLEQGMGGIWSKALAQGGQRSLLLASTQALDSSKLETLFSECREYATSVAVLHIDLSEPQLHDSLNSFIKSALSKNGHENLSGVFISLATTNEQSAAPLALLQTQHWLHNSKTRLDLLQTTAALTQKYTPPWVCVQSSMSSVLGGIGLAPYAAANTCLDAMTLQQNTLLDESKTACDWFSINWDATTIEVEDQQSTKAKEGRSHSLQEFALSEDEVWSLTERIITLAQPGQIAVSRGDLNQRRKQWLHTQGQAESATPTGEAAYQRPELSTAYVAPSNSVENTIAGIWQELLRLDKIGIHDSFFDLGGHSLLAIQAIGRLRQAFPVELDLRELLEENPTISSIAELIRKQLPDAEEINQMAALMAEVEAMSSEDVATELTSKDDKQ